MDILEIDGYRAVIQYDPDIDMFRGEFVGLNGGADFYAKDIDNLRKEGEISLKVFLEMCREDGVELRKNID
jgi:predicted HicB family RNase H-like nuclease